LPGVRRHCGTPSEIEASNLFERRMEQLAALEARHALPAIFS
jgi:hypothetical protein